MKRILIILRKDARRFWPYLLALWVVTVLDAPLSWFPANHVSFMERHWLRSQTLTLCSLACWLLVVLVIQQERLAGDRQYWLTRPFAWKELLAAKSLFVVLAINVPLLIVEYAALAEMGFASRAQLAVLLSVHLSATVYMFLPCMALAAMTSNLGQAVLAFIGILLAIVVFFHLFQPVPVALFHIDPISNWQGGRWVREDASALVVTVAAIAVLILQYSRRRPLLARLAAAAGLAAMLAIVCW